MIQLSVEVTNLDTGEIKAVTFPCNLRSELPDFFDCIILSVSPEIQLSRNDEIERLNDVLDEINSENPMMDEDYLALLIEASPSGDLFNEDFVRRLKENDFIFEDISGICSCYSMPTEEVAAQYLATELLVPFDRGVTSELLEEIEKSALSDYIDWSAVWSQYSIAGFKIIGPTDQIGKNTSQYIIHIK